MMQYNINIAIGARSRYAIFANVHNSSRLSITELTFFAAGRIGPTYGEPHGKSGAQTRKAE